MWGELSSEWGELSSECGASCLGASFLWGELSWGELSLGRVVRNPSVASKGALKHPERAPGNLSKTVSARDKDKIKKLYWTGHQTFPLCLTYKQHTVSWCFASYFVNAFAEKIIEVRGSILEELLRGLKPSQKFVR